MSNKINNNNSINSDDFTKKVSKSQNLISTPPPPKILDQQAHTMTTTMASSGQLLSQKRDPGQIDENQKKQDLQLLEEGSEIPEDFNPTSNIPKDEDEDPPELKALRLKNPFRGR